MLGKFHSNAVLIGLAARMEAAGKALDAAQSVYVNAVKAILLTRVDVKYEDHISDRRIRALLMKAQLADGKRGAEPLAATQEGPRGRAVGVSCQRNGVAAAARSVLLCGKRVRASRRGLLRRGKARRAAVSARFT